MWKLRLVLNNRVDDVWWWFEVGVWMPMSVVVIWRLRGFADLESLQLSTSLNSYALGTSLSEIASQNRRSNYHVDMLKKWATASQNMKTMCSK